MRQQALKYRVPFAPKTVLVLSFEGPEPDRRGFQAFKACIVFIEGLVKKKREKKRVRITV